MKWYLKVLKKYAVFEGRASRTEFWMFVLFNFIVGFFIGFFGALLGGVSSEDQSVLVNIYQLAILIPSISVSWRRMHDTDRSGWWSLVPIISLIYLVEKGTAGNNKFGPEPAVPKAA